MENMASAMRNGSAGREPPLRERKKQRTRQLIADTALELFLDRGFDAVTVADVARHAGVDTKTIYNYFAGKPDLVHHRLQDHEPELLDAIRERPAGESILAAYARSILGMQGFLHDDAATARLRAINRMIADSPTLLAHEEQAFAHLTASLAALIAAETGTRPTDVQPWVAAKALVGFQRAIVDYVRRETLAGTPNARLLRALRAQAKTGLGTLEHGLADYGIKPP